jgi:fructuronate reductase
LITRGDGGDSFEVIRSIAHAHAATDHEAWLEHLRDPRVAAVTLTVTEAGYLRAADGGLDRGSAAGDIAALRSDRAAAVRSAPARLVAGLAARHAAGAGPIAVVPCDNLPGNGAAVRRIVLELAEAVCTGLADQLAANTSFVTTMVDRITPRPTAADSDAVLAATGVRDACPVVTEPFTEWVLAGEFPAGRPAWDAAGATFTGDVTPFEQRKLWLLNGAHSLLAYAGSIRGHGTVAEAIDDQVCREWVQQWWNEAARHLAVPAPQVDDYRAALLTRFANHAIAHRLEQIAADGSQKLPIRVLPVIAEERAAGRLPLGATRILAAWIAHLRGRGVPVTDAAADRVLARAAGSLPSAVAAVLDELRPGLADDEPLVATVLAQATELGAG